MKHVLQLNTLYCGWILIRCRAKYREPRQRLFVYSEVMTAAFVTTSMYFAIRNLNCDLKRSINSIWLAAELNISLWWGPAQHFDLLIQWSLSTTKTPFNSVVYCWVDFWQKREITLAGLVSIAGKNTSASILSSRSTINLSSASKTDNLSFLFVKLLIEHLLLANSLVTGGESNNLFQ